MSKDPLADRQNIAGGQSRLQSLIEAVANILIGMGVAFGAQLVVFPALGMVVRIDQNIAITIAFTAVSLVRSYALRRFFNWLHSHRACLTKPGDR